MLPHLKLPVVPATIIRALRDQCIAYERGIFDLMRKLTKEYDGGLYEYRRYQNGAFMVVLDDQSIVTATWGAEEAKLTMEEVTIAANLIASEGGCVQAYEHGDEDTALFFRNLHDAQKDALLGRMINVVDWEASGYWREPTQEEMASSAGCKGAPSADSILRLLS